MRSDRPSDIGLRTICSMIATAAVATLTSANGAFAQETAKGLLAVRKRRQKDCSRFECARRGRFATARSAQQGKKSSRLQTCRFGFFDARTTRTEFG